MAYLRETPNALAPAATLTELHDALVTIADNATAIVGVIRNKYPDPFQLSAGGDND